MIFNIPPNTLKEIEDSVSNLDGRVTTLEDDLSTAQGNITTIQGDISTAQGNITTIQGNITTIQGDITTVQNDITALEDHEAYRVTGTISSSSLSITKSGVTADMVPVCCEFGTPANVQSDYTITTSANTVTFSDITLSASTTVDIILIKTN